MSKRIVAIIAVVIVLLALSGISLADKMETVKPESGDIHQEEAVEKAKTILAENFSDMETILARSTIEAAFGQIAAEYDAPIWYVEFSDSHGTYAVELSRHGDLLSYKAPYSQPYGPDEDELTGVTYTQPGQYDVPEQEAVETAKRNLREIGDFESRMGELTAKAYFLYGERYNNGWEPVWLIYFYQNNVLQQKMLLGYDGSYIHTVPADKQFERTSRIDEGLSESFEFNFYNMTVEEKAAFSAKWVPIMEEYTKTHPYVSDRNARMFYRATRQVFGVPDEDHLSKDDAAAIGKKAVVELGANEQTLPQRKIGYSYDVTDPSRPLWVLVIYRAVPDGPDAEPAAENSQTYEVKIDAKTGTVIATFVYEDENSFDGYYY